jgi:hypothetical protein
MAVKPKKITRAKIKSIDAHWIGEEPIDVNIKGYVQALNWYNYSFDVDESRAWLIEHMKDNGYTKSDISKVRQSPKYAIPTTVGWIARMLDNGNTLSASSLEYFKSRLAVVLDEPEAKEDVLEDRTVVNIQERTANKIKQIICDIEERIDNEVEFSIYSYLTTVEVSAQAAKVIKEHYQKFLDEVTSDDEQVKEAFGKNIKNERKFWQQFIDETDRFLGNKQITKVRKPRAAKVKSSVDLVKTLKFMKDSASLKLVSIQPTEIIGANQLWIYNTKYKKLTRLNAVGPKGLGIKGTTVIGFDVEQSTTKSIRKPEIVLPELLKAGKVSLRTFMDNIKTNTTEASGRCGPETLLLRAIK